MSQRVADLNVVATRDDGALSSTVVAGMGVARIENPARLLLQTYLVIPPTCSRAKEKNKMMRDCKNETAMHAGRYRTTYNKVDKSKKKKKRADKRCHEHLLHLSSVIKQGHRGKK